MPNFNLLKSLISPEEAQSLTTNTLEDYGTRPIDEDFLKEQTQAYRTKGKYNPYYYEKEAPLEQPWYSPDELLVGAMAPKIQHGLEKGIPIAAKEGFNVLKEMAKQAPKVLADETGAIGSNIKSVVSNPTEFRIPQIKGGKLADDLIVNYKSTDQDLIDRMLQRLKESDPERIARAEEQGYTVPTFHATKSPKDFTAFNLGSDNLIHSGTPEQAASRLHADFFPQGFPNNTRIMPLLVKAKNPLEVKDLGNFRDTAIIAELEKKNIIPEGSLDKIINNPSNSEVSDKMKNVLKDLGYDSLIYRNAGEIPASRKLLEQDLFQAEMNLNDLRSKVALEPEKYPKDFYYELTNKIDKLKEDKKRLRNIPLDKSIAVFNPQQIRSIWAQFKDPTSANFLAGSIPPALYYKHLLDKASGENK